MIPHMLENKKEGLTMNIFSSVEVKFFAIIYTILVIIFTKIKSKYTDYNFSLDSFINIFTIYPFWFE